MLAARHVGRPASDFAILTEADENQCPEVRITRYLHKRKNQPYRGPIRYTTLLDHTDHFEDVAFFVIRFIRLNCTFCTIVIGGSHRITKKATCVVSFVIQKVPAIILLRKPARKMTVQREPARRRVIQSQCVIDCCFLRDKACRVS